MPAMAQLEKDAKYSSIYQLLTIFLTERLDAYLEFQAENSDLLNNYGLVHDDCVAKMKLTSLTDLAHESHQIPYALIKETLRINDDEVESWVFKAVTAKLLKCKMDQINQLVIVSYCTERVFGPQQWANLRIRLATWRGNILTKLCSLVSLQRYTKALSNLQRASLVEKSRQKPQERMNVLSNALRTSKYDSEPVLRSCGISISKDFVHIDGRVLPTPKLISNNLVQAATFQATTNNLCGFEDGISHVESRYPAILFK